MVRKNIQGAILTGVAALLLAAAGCTKQSLDPSLKQNLQEDELATVVELKAALNAAYNFMSDPTYYGRDYIIYNEVRSDNCLASGSSNRFTNFWNRLLNNDRYANDTWHTIYEVIGQCNYVLTKEKVELKGKPETKQDIIGQAYALRALAHFDLLKLYGAMHVTAQQEKGIPYVTEWRGEDRQPKRTEPQAIKEQLYADLEAAIARLKPEAAKQAYMNAYAAHALYARVAQWFGDWEKAEEQAKAVIDEPGNFGIIAADDFIDAWGKKFQRNSLFEISYNLSDNPGINGIGNIYWGDAYGDVVPTPELEELLTKDPNDVRRGIIQENEGLKEETGGDLRYYRANGVKYTDVQAYDDNIPLFRFEEVVLIYAEALLHNGNTGEALIQLNKIPEARKAAPYPDATEEAILQERRKEFCFEGFRFDDLARTKRDVPESKATKAAPAGPGLIKRAYKYGSVDYSFPIPKNELNANANIKQNAGY